MSHKTPRRSGGASPPARRRKRPLHRLIEDRLIQKISFEEYRKKVRDVYRGPKGTILATCSVLSLHVPLGARLFRERRFDLGGVDEPHLVLPHVQSPGAGPGMPGGGPPMEEGAVVHACPQGLPRRRHLRGDRETIGGSQRCPLHPEP